MLTMKKTRPRLILILIIVVIMVVVLISFLYLANSGIENVVGFDYRGEGFTSLIRYKLYTSINAAEFRSGEKDHWIRTIAVGSESSAYGPVQLTRKLARDYRKRHSDLFTDTQRDYLDRFIIQGHKFLAHGGQAEVSNPPVVDPNVVLNKDGTLKKLYYDLDIFANTPYDANFDYGGGGELFGERDRALYKRVTSKILENIYDRRNNDIRLTWREWRFGGAGAIDPDNQDPAYRYAFNEKWIELHADECPFNWACMPDQITLDIVNEDTDSCMYRGFEGMVFTKQPSEFDRLYLTVNEPLIGPNEPEITFSCNNWERDWNLVLDVRAPYITHKGGVKGNELPKFLFTTEPNSRFCRSPIRVEYDEDYMLDCGTCNDEVKNLIRNLKDDIMSELSLRGYTLSSNFCNYVRLKLECVEYDFGRHEIKIKIPAKNTYKSVEKEYSFKLEGELVVPNSGISYFVAYGSIVSLNAEIRAIKDFDSRNTELSELIDSLIEEVYTHPVNVDLLIKNIGGYETYNDLIEELENDAQKIDSTAMVEGIEFWSGGISHISVFSNGDVSAEWIAGRASSILNREPTEICDYNVNFFKE
jgi:hypothetical protein